MAWAFFCCLLPTIVVQAITQQPVELRFKLPASDRNPFARELWAEIITPSQKTLRLPAFFIGNGQFAVRARATEVGEYRLGGIIEKIDDNSAALPVAPAGPDKQRVRKTQSLPPVMGYRGRPAQFLLGNGKPFTPIGANVAWASSDRVKFHLHAIREFSGQHLNWMRIWMVHWDGLNLDWLPEDMGPSPSPGIFDQRVAADWDKIIATAEENGVYLQIVLQYHGQYSTEVNANWNENPWNAANTRGFLKTPGEFFTSPVARRLTEQKYRYIVARWGYSPAVLAWELFNEVHWTDPIHKGNDDTTVAAWHDTMATYIREIDSYHHLVTTSTEDLRSSVYAKMDYYQPHLYAANILAGARQFVVPPEKLDRPVFYGEAGDDHMGLTTAQKNAGVAIVPPVWASLMGQGRYPAQPWLGEKLIQRGRLGELGAVARFLKASGLELQEGLTPFSPAVECATRVPFTLAGSYVWQRRPAPEIDVPLDGRELAEFSDIPRVYVGSAASLAEGYPGRATYHIEFPSEMVLQVRVVDMGVKGTTLRISVDGQIALEKTWPARATGAPTPERPAVLPLDGPAGRHTLVVENPGGPDWFELAGIDFPHDIPVLAAIGRRSAGFLALWVWHREGVYALKPPAPVGGTLLLEDVPAGAWHVTWWDTLKGVPFAPVVVEHPGGLLRLTVPPINHHAAVVLTR